MKMLLGVSALVEGGAGLALLIVPSATATILLGAALDTSVAASLSRVGGAAILALALACWVTRDLKSVASQGMVFAMLFYNGSVAAVLLFAGFGDGLHGALLWPAVAFHAAMGAWCLAHVVGNQKRVSP